MLFSRSRTHAYPPEFVIGDSDVLNVRKTLCILGVQVQDDLKWKSQVAMIVQKASRTTWVLGRMQSLGVDQETLVDFWKAEGRVHLELACPVWRCTVSQARDLDRARRMAMAAIAGLWEPSHSLQLLQLGLEPLATRRVRIYRTFAE